MQTSEDQDEPSNLVKFLALAGVCAIAVGILAIINLTTKDNDNNQYISCDTMFNSTACPEPEDEFPTSEQSKALPDASPEDHPDNCGGYSCKQLEKEAHEEQESNDREIERQLRASGIE